MRNRETGNELVVELEPSFSIENMVRSAARWRSLYLPWLYDGIVLTAHRDDPSLIPEQPRQRLGTPHLRPRREFDPAAAEEPSGSLDALGRFVPAWRRKRQGQSLAEYALILALIAIVSIIVLLFIGTQVSTVLSTAGGAL